MPKKLTGVPSVVQLPGGIKLNAVPFKIVEWHADGTPKLFELQPVGTPIVDGIWALFADEASLRVFKRS